MNSHNSSNKERKVLFISNGHGEDLSGSLILKALRSTHPELKIAGANPTSELCQYWGCDIRLAINPWYAHRGN